MAKTSKPSLAETHPELAAQADGWDPTSFTGGSGKKLRWRCNVGHTWDALIANRTNGSGCPVCTNRKVLEGFNDLQSTHPEIAAEADGWDPRTVTYGSNKSLNWKCKIGHKYVSTVSQRSSGGGCSKCSGKQVEIGFNDLTTRHPEIAAEADGWDPRTVTYGSNKSLNWKCKIGHIWNMPVSVRTNQKQGCPFCSGKRTLAGFNDLLKFDSELAAEADGWDPSKSTSGAGKRSWKCSIGHTWKESVWARVNVGLDCPYCSGKRTLLGFNDLATTHPSIASEAVPPVPAVTAFSNRKIQWQCRLGHKYAQVVANRVGQNQGCPFCANKKVLAGFNDLESTHPELAAEADGWDPTTVTFGSHLKMIWKCALGHRYSCDVNSRSSGRGCPFCANKKVLAGFNDLESTHPELAAEADGWDPTTVTFGSSLQRFWICINGHRWKTAINSRTSGYGCPSCANTGFNPNESGFIYFIDHFELEMFQIGITNFPDSRLNNHGRRGWEVIELRGPMDGQLTRQLETNCLHALEKRGAILGHKAGIDKFDGYSEAWTKASLNVTSIKQILDWVYEDETK